MLTYYDGKFLFFKMKTIDRFYSQWYLLSRIIIQNQDIVARSPHKIVINICFLAGGEGDPQWDHTEISHPDTPVGHIVFHIYI